MTHVEPIAVVEEKEGAVIPVAAPAPCPLDGLPVATHNYIHHLEQRITHLESEQARFTNALVKAGQFIFANPASKMMMAAFPKEAQEKLREFFGGN